MRAHRGQAYLPSHRKTRGCDGRTTVLPGKTTFCSDHCPTLSNCERRLVPPSPFGRWRERGFRFGAPGQTRGRGIGGGVKHLTWASIWACMFWGVRSILGGNEEQKNAKILLVDL